MPRDRRVQQLCRDFIARTKSVQGPNSALPFSKHGINHGHTRINMTSLKAARGGTIFPVGATSRPMGEVGLSFSCRGSEPTIDTEQASTSERSRPGVAAVPRDWIEFLRAVQRWRNQNARILGEFGVCDCALDPETSAALACSAPRSLLSLQQKVKQRLLAHWFWKALQALFSRCICRDQRLAST